MSQPQHSGEIPTVLVVEDDRDLADTYSVWLEPEYEVRTAYSGSDGLAWYGPEVDIVLLDRRILNLAGRSIIQNMAKRNVDDQKAMITSIDPGSELIDLPCDDYLTRPVTKPQLRDTVRELQLRSELDDEIQRHFTLTSKIAAFKNGNANETDAALADLRREAERIRARIQDRLE